MKIIKTKIPFFFNQKSFHFYLIGAFSFFLPLWPDVAVLMIILLFVNNLLSGALFKNFKQVLQPLPLTSISLYLIYLVGLTYTTDMADGLSDVETKLTLLVFPLLLFTGPQLSKKNYNQIFMAFAIACALVILRGGFLTFYYNMVINEVGYFSVLTGIHSSFFCLYLGVAIFFLAQQITQEGKEALSKKKKNLYIGLLLFLSVSIFFLMARMGFFTLVFLFSIFYITHQFKNGKTSTGLMKMIAVWCLVATIAWLIPTSKISIYGKINIPKVNITKKEEADVRIPIWISSLEVARKQILFGVGTGDVHVELEKVYQKRNFKLGIQHEFNPHNQYLQTSIALGLIGLSILLINFLYPMKLAFEKEHTIYLFFLLLFGMGCLTESLLERESGVLFFAFFNSLFARELYKRE